MLIKTRPDSLLVNCKSLKRINIGTRFTWPGIASPTAKSENKTRPVTVIILEIAKAHILASIKVIVTEKPVTIKLFRNERPTLLTSKRNLKLSSDHFSGRAKGLLYTSLSVFVDPKTTIRLGIMIKTEKITRETILLTLYIISAPYFSYRLLRNLRCNRVTKTKTMMKKIDCVAAYPILSSLKTV